MANAAPRKNHFSQIRSIYQQFPGKVNQKTRRLKHPKTSKIQRTRSREDPRTNIQEHRPKRPKRELRFWSLDLLWRLEVGCLRPFTLMRNITDVANPLTLLSC